MQCTRFGEECEQVLRSYKFYLALENSECTDYITEKFWETLHRGVIPIVYGTSRLDYEKVAPPHSFIHVQDFQTIQELAEYIKLVAASDSLYNSYFHWRRFGTVSTQKMFTPKFLYCNVSDRLAKDENRLTHMKRDWKEWWTGYCFRGTIPQ